MKKPRFVFAMMAAGLILMKPQTALSCAQQAMRLWYVSVAPAVFPFLALMPVLTGRDACKAYNALFSRIMQPVFHLPGAAAPAVIIAMLAGSPGGAIAIRNIAAETGMERAKVKRLAMALCGVSPAYLILGVGIALHGSAAYGFRLALIQLFIQISILLITRNVKTSEDAEGCEAYEKKDAGIQSAVLTTLGICGYMILFGVLAGILSSLAGNTAGQFLLVAMDLPSGLAAFAPNMQAAVIGAAIGFGGMCIAAQNMAVLGNIKWTDYLKGRCISSAMFACLAAIALPQRACEAQDVFAGISPMFAGSILSVLIMSVPALVVLSKNLFLNNSEWDEFHGKNDQINHML